MNKSDLTRGGVVGAGALALAAALWLAFDSPDDGEGGAAGAVPTAVIRPPDEASAPSPATSGPVPDAAVAPVVEGVAPAVAPADASAARVEVPAPAVAPAPDGPSATTAEALPTPPPTPDGAGATPPAEANVDLVLDQREPDAGDDVRSADAPSVAVPTSYPVSEAARYFVPREERRPGNLGGPPPLDFPGGPNDPDGPDGPDGGGFAPPPAPGD